MKTSLTILASPSGSCTEFFGPPPESHLGDASSFQPKPVETAI